MTDLSNIEQLAQTALSRKTDATAKKELIQKLITSQNRKRLKKTKRAASNVFAVLVIAACLFSVVLHAMKIGG